ncbi:MAG TPA: hypothetical protein VK957_05330 [Lunatimonas sp.]|nr:hypothetical protein [Lunatimonas sp.]
MRCVQEGDFGYIVNFWSDGTHQIRGDATSGRTFSAMNEAAVADSMVSDLLDMYVYRVPEELHFKSDPDGLVNLIDDPAYQEKIGHMKSRLIREMKCTRDPIYNEFEDRFMKN